MASQTTDRIYLVKTIQGRENPAWVASLNSDPTNYVPLPMTPSRHFDGLAIIHRGYAYLFDIDRVERLDGGIVQCGEREDQPVVENWRIHVRLGSMEVEETHIRGFQGIRYMNRHQLVATLQSV